jgi:hypothetical protein
VSSTRDKEKSIDNVFCESSHMTIGLGIEVAGVSPYAISSHLTRIDISKIEKLMACRGA